MPPISDIPSGDSVYKQVCLHNKWLNKILENVLVFTHVCVVPFDIPRAYLEKKVSWNYTHFVYSVYTRLAQQCEQVF